MKMPDVEVDGYYCPEIKSRWKSYNVYRLMLWVCMVNELTIVFSPSEVAHRGFYAQATLQAVAIIFIGMPLAYSEICLAQYTNCNIFTVWNFFPLFGNLGYATFYLNFVKTIYLLVLTSWYLIYTFYAAMDTPPWYDCKEFEDVKCMVKRVNISTFQHCIEAQTLFSADCGMKTASNCFFEREIGYHSTKNTLNCYRPWKTVLAICIVCSSIYILSIKKEKIIQVVAKCFAFYLSVTTLMLFGLALSAGGTWYGAKIRVNWYNFNFYGSFYILSRGFRSVNAGSGILLYLSRDVSFRSPATMTATSTCLFSLFVSLICALIAFSGIRTMSYYHGEEDNIIEIGCDNFFEIFAGISEVFIYFSLPLWGFFWFSVCFLGVYLNFWIQYLYLQETLRDNWGLSKIKTKWSGIILMMLIILCTLPFLCSDMTTVLTDATEIMQIFNGFLLSISLYWFYGIHNHNVDIIFMIGIKANYFWKLTWLLSPVLFFSSLYRACVVLQIKIYENSYYIESLHIHINEIALGVVLGIYTLIIVIGIFVQMFKFCLRREFRQIISPTKDWGPKDVILSRSRNMFMPEIMTREFLYRQVRIRGYYKKRKAGGTVIKEKQPTQTAGTEMTWSVMTSN